ncbi:hypothetical protein KIN20_021325 [Parelaphostrongylus tenuis]|uniref:Uncharacterized protein n=1 Tax=Parelaphostrongylus tenuis TaxID=148309 RepID=A0AAD5MP20_PARTN|nr:hypothetical protein KIN20_021325 [Parelaphostrongylus tenuis]
MSDDSDRSRTNRLLNGLRHDDDTAAAVFVPSKRLFALERMNHFAINPSISYYRSSDQCQLLHAHVSEFSNSSHIEKNKCDIWMSF